MTNPARLDGYIYGTLILYCLLFAVSVPLAYFAIDIGLILLFFRALWHHQDIHPDYTWTLLVGCYLFICLVSAWNGYNVKVSLEKTWHVAYTMVGPFILASFVIKDRIRRRSLLLPISISLAIACIYEIYQGLIGLGSEGGFLGRLQLAGQIVQVVPLVVFASTSETWKKKYTQAGLVFLSLFAIIALIFTGVRGAWVAMGVVLAVTFLKIPVKLQQKIYFMFALTIISIAIFFVQPKLQNTFVSGVTLKTQSVSERLLMWRSAGSMFLDYPLLGIGLGNFGDLYEQKYILPEAKEGRHPHPHNIYLQTLSEAGILGFVSFVAVWAYAFTVLVRNRKRPGADFWQQAVPIAVIGFLIYGLTDNVIYHFPAGFQFCWFLIGSCWRNS